VAFAVWWRHSGGCGGGAPARVAAADLAEAPRGEVFFLAYCSRLEVKAGGGLDSAPRELDSAQRRREARRSRGTERGRGGRSRRTAARRRGRASRRQGWSAPCSKRVVFAAAAWAGGAAGVEATAAAAGSSSVRAGGGAAAPPRRGVGDGASPFLCVFTTRGCSSFCSTTTERALQSRPALWPLPAGPPLAMAP
jgi:hypothetical protein